MNEYYPCFIFNGQMFYVIYNITNYTNIKLQFNININNNIIIDHHYYYYQYIYH